MDKPLEKIVFDKLQPLVDNVMQKFMGVTIGELGKDISSKLKQNPLLGFEIDTLKDFKTAKKNFKNQYIKRLLLTHYGNISEVARIAEVDRRSVHRFVVQARLNAKKIRKDMWKPSYLRQEALSSVISDVLKDYSEILHPIKIEQAYKDISKISKDIIKELPEEPMTLKEAEREFEKQYLQKVLEGENHNISRVAKRIKLRYETLHRKLKSLGI